MLKDNLNCTTKRVGKHKISVFVVARFDKKPETYTQNHLRKIIINENNNIWTTGTGKTHTLLQHMKNF